jgi:hypothetical protein
MTRTAAWLALLLALGILALGVYVSRSGVAAQGVGPVALESRMTNAPESADLDSVAEPDSAQLEARRPTEELPAEIHLRIVAASNGQPIQDARVVMRESRSLRQWRSDGAGEVRVPCTHSAEQHGICARFVGWRADVTANGFVGREISGQGPLPDEAPLLVELERGASLRFIAQDGSGAPLAAVQLRVTIVKESQIVFDADTVVRYAGGETGSSGKELTILEGTFTGKIERGTTTGTIKRSLDGTTHRVASGVVRQGVPVSVKAKNTISRGTGTNGELTIEDLPTGQIIEMKVSDAKETHDLGSFVLSPGEARVEHWMRPARPSIVGRCVALDGSPVVGVLIGLWGAAGDEASEFLMSVKQTALTHAITDARGEFHFERVAVGSWFVGPDPIANNALFCLARRVDLLSPFEARMHFQLSPQLEVAGTLRDADGLAVGDVFVRIHPLGCAGVLQTTTDAQGRWRIGPLARGEYEVEVLRDTEVLLERSVGVDYPSPYRLDLAIER